MSAKEFQVVVDRIPFMRFLGLQVDVQGDDNVETTMPFDDRFVGNTFLKYIHGGIISSFMEATSSLTVIDKPENGKPKPINLTVDFLRPAKDKPVHCRARVTRSGRRLASVEALAWQEDVEKPVAKGLFHFLLV